MSLLRYEAFVEVANTCSLSRAAEKLNQTVPGISYTISKLEDEFGVALLIRNRSKLQLTEDAHRLLPHIIAVLNVNKRLEREVTAIKTKNAGSVNVGSITGVARRWMPQLMRDFKEANPDISVNFLINGYENLFQMLLLTTVDLAVMVDPCSEHINFMPFKKDRLYALFPAVDECQFVLEKKRVSATDLAAFELIAPDWGRDEAMESFLSGKNVRYFINDAQTIISMVKEGFGVGIVSEIFLEDYSADIIAAPIEDGPSRILGICTNSNLRLTHGAELFRRYMIDWLAEKRVSDIANM